MNQKEEQVNVFFIKFFYGRRKAIFGKKQQHHDKINPLYLTDFKHA